MKTRFSLFFWVLFASAGLYAQTHIKVDNPSTWSTSSLQDYIGQTVIFDVPIYVCSNSSGYTVSTRRLFTPTNQHIPCIPQSKNPFYQLNADGAMSLSGVSGYHRCGEKIYNLKAKVNGTSSLSFISGEWRGNTRAELEAGIPEEDLGDYRLLICTMNLEYYLAAGTGSGGMGPSTSAQHQKQRTKIRKALARIAADVYGFVEIESGDVALQEIADDLNSSLSGRSYTIISDGSSPNGTFTKAGFVYDAKKVEPIGKLQEINEKVTNRKKMICFKEKETGEYFIFSVNHFKAKSGSGAAGGDANQNDGQGQFNATRVAEAQAIINHYTAYSKQAAIKREKDILIMGDLNAYGKEDPIMLFLKNGMLDLHREFHADTSYSYQFGGLAGYLDHAICSPTLFPQVTGVCGFHINSDEKDDYTYDKSSDNTMFRCSDHDPVLVGLKLDSTLNYDPSPTINTVEVMSDNTAELTIRNAFIDGTDSYYAIYDISGRPIAWSAKPIKIESNLEVIQKPTAPGVYIIYIYYQGAVYPHKFIVR